MARTPLDVTIDQQGYVTDVQEAPPPPGGVAPPAGPSPREAHRQNTVQARAEALRAKRTAIIRRALERRRVARDAEQEAAIARSREEAGAAEDHVQPDWVVASEVIIPPEYQREFRQEKALGYAKRFRWRKFTAVSVNRRPDGTLALVDGQHRLWAAQRVFGPDVRVPCVFTHSETTPEEADSFDAINTERTGLNYNAAFRARIHAGDPDSLQVVLLLKEQGLRPLWPTEQRGIPGTVTACRTVQYMVEKAGSSSARAVLSILREVWKDDPEGYRDFILGGLWQFLLRYDGYVRRDRVVEVLGRLKSPKDLDELTNDHRSTVNSSAAAACCGAIHYLYNYRMKMADALPPYAPESVTRHNAITRRHARRWKDAHERAKGAKGLSRARVSAF